jgi:recombination protein RecA
VSTLKPRKKRSGQAARIKDAINAAMQKPVIRLGSDAYFKLEKIPTGSLSIDRITGGGFTRGRHIDLVGHWSAGKSYIMLRTIALAQQRGEMCALVDPEKVFDQMWFKHLGGIPEELLLFQPEKEWNAEDAVGVMMLLADLIDDESVAVVGVDSTAALVTQEEMRKDIREGDDRVATQARMMSRAMRRITTMNRKTIFIWTNQERSNIGHGAMFQPVTYPGGRAMSFYATTRIEFKKTGKVKRKKNVAEKGKLVEKEMQVGNWIQVRAEKEKSTRPYMQAAFVFDNERGRIDPLSEIIQLGLEDGLIHKSGNSFRYDAISDDESIYGANEKAFRKQLVAAPEISTELVELIQQQTLELAKLDNEED